MAEMTDNLASSVLKGDGVTRNELEQLCRYFLRRTPRQALMRFDPTDGRYRPYPSQVEQFREHHGAQAWLYNPWSGDKRTPQDIGADPFGILCMPPDWQPVP